MDALGSMGLPFPLGPAPSAAEAGRGRLAPFAAWNCGAWRLKALSHSDCPEPAHTLAAWCLSPRRG